MLLFLMKVIQIQLFCVRSLGQNIKIIFDQEKYWWRYLRRHPSHPSEHNYASLVKPFLTKKKWYLKCPWQAKAKVGSCLLSHYKWQCSVWPKQTSNLHVFLPTEDTQSCSQPYKLWSMHYNTIGKKAFIIHNQSV